MKTRMRRGEFKILVADHEGNILEAYIVRLDPATVTRHGNDFVTGEPGEESSIAYVLDNDLNARYSQIADPN